MLADLFRLLKALSKTERLLFFGAGLIFIAALTFIGLGYFYKNTILEPATGGEYIEGLVSQPIAINPILAGSNDADRDLTEIAFANLGILLDHYATSTDGKVITVTLKPELKWSDGEPLTSDDLVFTIETIQNPETNSPLALSWQGVVAERLSEREVRLTIKTPYVYFLDTIQALKIIPRHIFESVPPANLRLSNYNLEPVGSGPFAFSRSEKKKTGFLSTYTFVINKNFTGTRPRLQTLTFKFFQNYKEATDAFNNKSIDGLGGLDPSQLEELKIVHQIVELNIPRYYAVFFNPNVAPSLKDAAVRHALNSAVDKAGIIQAAFGSHALIVNGPLLPYIEGYDPDIYASDTFSLADASATLEKAGWKLGADGLPAQAGVRAKTIGKTTTKLAFEIVVPQLPFLMSAADKLQHDFAAIGVKITTEVLPPADITNNIIKTRNYQLLLFGNVLRGNPDVFSFWHSSQRFQPGLNLALYENKTVDALLESIRKDQNPVTRAQSLSKLQKQIHDDTPAIFLFSPNYLYAAPKNLGGLEAGVINSAPERFKNISAWYLKTTRVFK